MKWKEFVTSYLSFTRKERLGVIVIVLIVLGIFFFPTVFSKNNTKNVATDTAWIAGMKRLEQKEAENENNQYQKQYSDDNSTAYQYDRSANNYYSKAKGELFYFDPNTLSTEGWQKLGLRDKTIHTIQNYLSKGGQLNREAKLTTIKTLQIKHQQKPNLLKPILHGIRLLMLMQQIRPPLLHYPA
jgi:hypothetical protein